MIIKFLKNKNYKKVWNNMLDFINNRNINTLDEIWFVQHNPVFTCGCNKYNFYKINNKNIKKIPIIFNDRGGGITYHGPGQQLIYTLIDLRKNNLNIKQFIFLLEEIVIKVLKKFYITSHRISGLYGVYVNNKKICFIGLKIKNGYIFHGISLNIKMNLLPFKYIYPCGYNIKVTQIYDFYKNISFNEVRLKLCIEFIEIFNKLN